MSVTLASTLLFAVTVMNVEADALLYYDPPSPWWPSYSYAFTRGSSILREQGEKLLLMNAEPPVYGTTSVIALVNRSGSGNLNKPLGGESATVDALTGR
jgi:hypothetical protein